MSKIGLLFYGLIVVLICQAWSACPPKPPAECRSFLELSLEQRSVEFQTYPLEKQLEIYLCAMKTEPPNSSLAYSIADRGEQAVPVVVAKLKSLKNEGDQEDVIYVLEVMSDRGYLRGKKEVISQIRDVVDAMKLDLIKNRSSERLRKIQVNSGVKPFTYTP